MDDADVLIPLLFDMQQGARSFVELYDGVLAGTIDPELLGEIDKLRQMHTAGAETATASIASKKSVATITHPSHRDVAPMQSLRARVIMRKTVD
jgi:hypothetical protein